MNKKGFTLIELLAVLIILGIIMMVAVPNTVSILDKNKKRTFISDAKRFIALVENEIRKDDSLDVTENNHAMVFTLSYIDDGTFEKDPDGQEYKPNKDKSFVAVVKKRDDETGYSTYKYYVYLKGGKREVALTELSKLGIENIQNGSAGYNLGVGNHITINDGSDVIDATIDVYKNK